MYQKIRTIMYLSDNYYDQDDAFGVLICQDNNEFFSFCRGNLKNQDTVNVHTKFNIGSISKTILSVMILKMVEMNLIKLDDKLIKYLYEFEMVDERYKDITIRMLLNHSAGLFGCAALNYTGYGGVNTIKNEFLKNLKSQNLNYNPGDMGVYCDDGFFLAQILIEKIFKKNFLECINNILGFHEISGSIGTLSDRNNAFYKNENILETISACGIAGLSSSLFELCDFGNKILNNEIISKTTKDKLFENQRKFISKPYSDFFSFGLGWDFVFKISNKDAFLKRGATSQYSSILLIVPDENLVVTMFTSDTRKRFEIEKILNTLFGSAHNEFSDKPLTRIAPTDCDGIYFSKNNLYKICFRKNKLKIYQIGSESDFCKEFEFNGNVFVDKHDKISRYYFNKVEGQIFFVKYNRFFNSHDVLYKKLYFSNLISKKSNQKIMQSFHNNLWFRTSGIFNEISYSRNHHHMIKPHIIFSETFDDIDSQLVKFDGIKFFKNNKLEPIGNFERQATAELFTINSEFDKIFYFNNFYIPKNKILILKKGIHKMSIKKANDSKWVCINSAGKLSVNIPKQGRFYVFSSDGDLLFDSFINKDTLYSLNCDGKIYYIEMLANDNATFSTSFQNSI